MKRAGERSSDQMRPVIIERAVNKHAEGSALISFGDTRVLCTASLESGVPSFLRGRGRGWITSEYGMLPRSTHERMDREAARGKQGGEPLRSALIGRSLRGCVDMKSIGERTIKLDCDVLQADGGTRTASLPAVVSRFRCWLAQDLSRPGYNLSQPYLSVLWAIT